MNLPEIFSSNSPNIHQAPHSFTQPRRSDLRDVLIFPSVKKTCGFTEILDVIEINAPENGLMILKASITAIKSYSVQWKFNTWNVQTYEHFQYF